MFCLLLAFLGVWISLRDDSGALALRYRPKYGNHDGKPIGDLFKFHSDPDILSPKPRVTTLVNDRSLLSSGFILVAPQGPWEAPWYSWGPHIYTSEGELVWNGLSSVGEVLPAQRKMRVNDFRACDLFGMTGQHLCWNEDDVFDEGHHSTNRIFNSEYQQAVNDFSGVVNISRPQTHDFHTVTGGASFLQLRTVPRPANLTAYEGPEDGWIKDGCFQEINIQSQNVDFEWCVLEGLGDFDDTKIYMKVGQNAIRHGNLTSLIAGIGTEKHAWDYIHINSVDLTSEGDYIASLRHFDQVVKIAGPRNTHGLAPGSIIWRLGGKKSTLDVEESARFSRQHHATSIRIGDGEEDILLFDNEWEGYNEAGASSSSAKLIKLRTDAGKAELVQSYEQPYKLLARANGDAQMLPNGNVLVGWGYLPQTSEFSPTGDLLLNLEFSPTENSYAHSYRSYKFDWVGKPTWAPKLLAYREDCTSALTLYASWNGATEINAWRFLFADNEEDQWNEIDTVQRTGFETKASSMKVPYSARYVQAQPLDKDGKVLYENVTREIWMPNSTALLNLNVQCEREGCFNKSGVSARFSYADDFNGVSSCFDGRLSGTQTLFYAELLGSMVLACVIICGVWYFWIPLRNWLYSLPAVGSYLHPPEEFSYQPLKQEEGERLT